MSILSTINFSVPPGLKDVGDYLGRLGKFGHHCWDIKGSVRDTYLDRIRPAILAHLDRRIPSRSSIIITAYMIGRRKSSAAPTVLFVSEDRRGRKEARIVARASGILSPHKGWKTAHGSRDPGWGGELEQLASGRCASKAGRFSQTPATRVLYDPTRPITSRGMTLYIDLDSEVRSFTANFIRIKGRPMFVGPEHAFFTRSAEQASSSVDADDDFEIDSDDDTDTISAGDEPIGFIELDSEAESSSDESDSSADYDDYDTFSESSTDSSEEEIIEEWIPRGSALNTVDLRNQTLQIELQAPPLDSLVPFGVLTEWSTDKDWALIEVQGDNDELISEFRNAKHDDLSTMKPARPGLRCATVITQTASAGILSGTLSATISDMRVPNGESFQEVFSIKLGGTLADGDCGSLVVDATTGELYGHVVAGCRSNGFAYVMAAFHTLPDILGCLSEEKEDESVRGNGLLTVDLAVSTGQIVELYRPSIEDCLGLTSSDRNSPKEIVRRIRGIKRIHPNSLADTVHPILLKMVTLSSILDPEVIRESHVLFDVGSDADFVSADFARRMGLQYDVSNALDGKLPISTAAFGHRRRFSRAYSSGNLRRHSRGVHCSTHSSWTCGSSSGFSHGHHIKPHRPYHDHHTNQDDLLCGDGTDDDYRAYGNFTDHDYCIDHGDDNADCSQCDHRTDCPDHADSVDRDRNQDHSLHYGHHAHHGYHTDQDNPPEHLCHPEDDRRGQQYDHNHFSLELSTSPHSPRILESCSHDDLIGEVDPHDSPTLQHDPSGGEADPRDTECPPSPASIAKHRHCNSD